VGRGNPAALRSGSPYKPFASDYRPKSPFAYAPSTDPERVAATEGNRGSQTSERDPGDISDEDAIGENFSDEGSGGGDFSAPTRWLARSRDWTWYHGFLLVEVPPNINWGSAKLQNLPKSRYLELHFNYFGTRFETGMAPSNYILEEEANATLDDNRRLIGAWCAGDPEPYFPGFWDCNEASFYYLDYPNNHWYKYFYRW
jgi:hypothetical protein